MAAEFNSENAPILYGLVERTVEDFYAHPADSYPDFEGEQLAGTYALKDSITAVTANFPPDEATARTTLHEIIEHIDADVFEHLDVESGEEEVTYSQVVSSLASFVIESAIWDQRFDVVVEDDMRTGGNNALDTIAPMQLAAHINRVGGQVASFYAPIMEDLTKRLNGEYGPIPD